MDSKATRVGRCELWPRPSIYAVTGAALWGWRWAIEDGPAAVRFSPVDLRPLNTGVLKICIFKTPGGEPKPRFV